ncbi:MAG: hypothetical protein A2677_00910 [Candidatus Komeilibacteria bacterium RIFCSPHIGHO2_01_FULL_52_14]|uniref:Glutathione synthetase n=1 Tax=Candidatus Komeilibacteria bacterium RIFCSPHIGHO2_01_FULL_52_14 TaxID=1798549 RepID=A0A1G2BJS1_9BACT|nr:MAG: hypothetical protein A2677_00910 [Candidatus Komeilibacteria bacterium RIFCSPHIGHO2_01_FULL_52_14]
MKHTHGLHHYHQTKKLQKIVSSDATKEFVDHAMYLLGILAPLMTVPQIVKIWQVHSAAGVSVFSWAAYAIGSLAWFVYGVVHKEKPIIFANGFACLLQFAVVISVMVFS